MSQEIPPAPGSGVPPPPPPVPSPPISASSQNTAMLVLSYLGLLALIPLIVAKDDREVQWHAKHGLVLTVAFIALYVVVSFLGAIAWFLAAMLFPLVGLLWLAVSILAILKAVKGERLLIPGLSDFVEKF